MLASIKEIKFAFIAILLIAVVGSCAAVAFIPVPRMVNHAYLGR